MFAPRLDTRKSVVHAAPKQHRAYPTKWLDIATAITFAFEGSGYGQVSGNFDGQGLSVGGLQWNYGQGSLQNKILKPYIDKYGTDRLDSFFPLSSKVSASAYMTPKQGIKFAKQMQDSKLTLKGRRWRLKEDWQRMWRKFLLTDEVIALQKKACDSVASKAFYYCEQYDFKSIKAFCFFFDIVTQNGSMKGVQVPQFDRSDYLNSVAKEGDNNAFQWSINQADKEAMSLWMLACARARHNRWRSDVLMRKGTIAHGHGLVHGKNFSFDSWFTSMAAVASARPQRFDFDGNQVDAMYYDGNNLGSIAKWLSDTNAGLDDINDLLSVPGTYVMIKNKASKVALDQKFFEANYRLLQ